MHPQPSNPHLDPPTKPLSSQPTSPVTPSNTTHSSSQPPTPSAMSHSPLPVLPPIALPLPSSSTIPSIPTPIHPPLPQPSRPPLSSFASPTFATPPPPLALPDDDHHANMYHNTRRRPRLPPISPSPRLPSALPPSASPRLPTSPPSLHFPYSNELPSPPPSRPPLMPPVSSSPNPYITPRKRLVFRLPIDSTVDESEVDPLFSALPAKRSKPFLPSPSEMLSGKRANYAHYPCNNRNQTSCTATPSPLPSFSTAAVTSPTPKNITSPYLFSHVPLVFPPDVITGRHSSAAKPPKHPRSPKVVGGGGQQQQQQQQQRSPGLLTAAINEIKEERIKGDSPSTGSLVSPVGVGMEERERDGDERDGREGERREGEKDAHIVRQNFERYERHEERRNQQPMREQQQVVPNSRQQGQGGYQEQGERGGTGVLNERREGGVRIERINNRGYRPRPIPKQEPTIIQVKTEPRQRNRPAASSSSEDERSLLQRMGEVAHDPLQCGVCGARFARKSNRLKHVRSVHSTERRFKCHICSYAFKRQDHLHKHIASVHEKRRNFRCTICEAAFAEKFNLKKHIKTVHFKHSGLTARAINEKTAMAMKCAEVER